jgi:dipeptidyl aminopeptidase/acylaminoacyl peptidase
MRPLACCLYISLLSISFFCTPAFCQSKHPFTFEDMMALKRVGEPVPSPDGKWVLFSAVDVNLEANTKTPHVWIVPLAGGQEREIISDQDADRPRWAPDGKRFAFVSTKEGGSQIWIADFDTAAGKVTGVHKLTSIATEADGELWSPDGKTIAFTSRVYPECTGSPTEQEICNKQKMDEVAKSKVKALIFTRLLYRHWNAFQAGKRNHIFVVDAPPLGVYDQFSNTTPRDLTPGDYDAPPFSLGGQDLYAFSPDGQELCYTSNHDKVEATSTNNDLWIVPVHVETAASAVQPKNITADNLAADETPVYSPDGKYIAYRAQKRPGYESDRFRLMLYDRKTGEKTNLTENFDRWVGSFAWSLDSSQILFAAEDRGNQPIFLVDVYPGKSSAEKYTSCDLCEGAIHILTLEPGYKDDIAVTRNDVVLYTQMTAMNPNTIWLNEPRFTHVDPVTKQKQPVTASRDLLPFFNQPVTGYLPEPFWFTGANNDKVEGFLVKPPNFDPNKKYPVKFLIHGGPQGAWGDDWSYRWNPELFAANGYVIVMINFHGSTGYGQKFIDAINGDWGGAPFEDLMKGLDYAEQHYPFIDKDRECALGASYGGYMANWILGHTNRFKCIVSHDGMFNTESAWGTTEELWFNEWEFKGTPWTNRELYRKWSPHLSAPSFKTPTLVVHGQLDYRLDVSEGYQLFTTLQRLNIPSKMLYFPDEGHWVLKPQNSRLWYQTVNAWVDQWMKK